jgi:hypothetical protein
MKQTYTIMGILGVFVLLLGTVGVYAYSDTNNARQGMMGNYLGTYEGMMNSNTNTPNINAESYSGMMKNIDSTTRDKMNALHDEMIKNLDPETAKQMDAMHDACMGNND